MVHVVSLVSLTHTRTFLACDLRCQITVVAMGNTTAVYSNGVEIDTLLPWQSSAYNLSGSSGAFSVSSSAPVVAGTICPSYVAPADVCDAARAWVYLGPTENRTSSVRIRNTGNMSETLHLFRLQHEDHVSGRLAKPPHWQHVALGMAHASGEDRVWTTSSMWSAASTIAGGDVICSTSGNIYVSGDADREHLQVGELLTSCAHRFWSPVSVFAASEVNITMPQGAHALNVIATTESTWSRSRRSTRPAKSTLPSTAGALPPSLT